MPNEADKLARDFLDTIADLEKELDSRLRRRDQGRGSQPLGLVSAVRDLRDDAVVQRYEVELTALGNLRNSIAHNRYRNGAPIATPLPETVQAAQRILQELVSPSTVYRLTRDKQPPMVFEENDPLQESLLTMAQASISQAPVRAGGRIDKMLTTNAVARWLADNFDPEGAVMVENVTIADVLEHLEPEEKPQFVRRDLPAAAAVALLMSEAPPLALLVTQNGKHEEKILGVLVRADIPEIQQSLAITVI